METTAPTSGRTGRRLTRTNRVGLVVLGLLGVVDAISPLLGPDTSEPGVTGPPAGIVVLGSVLGFVTIAAVVWAWTTGRRTAVRLAVGARLLSVVTALPAFFVDVPAAVKAVVAAFVVVTVAGVVATLWPTSRR